MWVRNEIIMLKKENNYAYIDNLRGKLEYKKKNTA